MSFLFDLLGIFEFNLHLCDMNYPLMHAFFGRSGLVLCTRGFHELLVNGRPYRLSVGSLLLVSPLYIIQSVARSDDYQERSILTDPHILYDTLYQVSKIVVRLRMLNHPCVELDEDMQQRFVQHADTIQFWQSHVDGNSDDNEQKMASLISEQIVRQSILEVALFIYQHIPLSQSKDTTQEKVFFDFITCLQQELYQHRSVAYYASNAHLSVGHFSSIIRQILGIPPSTLITAFTISSAKSLLSKPDGNIKSIATALGFPEQYTFRKYFKQHTGLSPSAFRQSCFPL